MLCGNLSHSGRHGRLPLQHGRLPLQHGRLPLQKKVVISCVGCFLNNRRQHRQLMTTFVFYFSLPI